MGWILSSKSQILFLSSIGVCRTIMEFYTFSMSETLEQIWQKQFSESLNPYQNLIKSVISGILLIRGLTGHLYIASYFLILYPILMGKLRSVLLLWMFLSAVRSILLNIGVIILGFIFCSTMENLTRFCFDFAARKAIDLGCSVYMWTVVNNYYHSMKRLTYGRSHIQSPLSSPVASDQFVDETSSSILSEEWSLPASLVEELHKNTKENLHEGSSNVGPTDNENIMSRSVDSLLAQAMVDWFIKKVFKFKPKVDNTIEKSSSLSHLKPNEVAALKVKIKRSIADIKDEDIADLLMSEDEGKVNSIESKGNLRTNLKRKQDKEDHLEIRNESSTHDECDKKNINREKSSDIMYNLPEGVTCRKMSTGENENLPDFFDVTPKILGDSSVSNYLISADLSENPFDTQTISQLSFNRNPINFGPSKALSLVKNLFNDSIEESIQKTIENKIKNIKLNEKSPNRVIKNVDFLDETIPNKSSNDKNFLKNDKALESSYSIVKSLLDDIIIGTVVSSKKGILKKTQLDDRTCASTRCESCKILRFSKESKMNSMGLNNSGITKKLTFQDERKNHKNRYGLDLSEYPNVKNALKDINMDDINNKITAIRDLSKIRNKENNYNYKQEILKKKFDENLNKSAAQVKSLRYYYRRINPIKVPIKKSKEASLRQKSLMSILESIKINDIKHLNLTQITGKPDINLNEFNKRCINDFKKVNITRHSSSQTITTKRLLEKIREFEEN